MISRQRFPKKQKDFSGGGGAGLDRRVMAIFTRRKLLSASILLAAGATISGLSMLGCRGTDEGTDEDFYTKGELLGRLDFVGEGHVQMNTPLNTELDGRLFFMNSALSPTDLITPTETFYIRTRASNLLDLEKPWFIKIRQPTGESYIAAKELIATEVPQGTHLMECAGNTRGGQFGLMSVAEWDGVLLTGLLERAHMTDARSRILISGFDSYTATSTSSIPGASWIFSTEEIIKSNAFLATKMNGKPLTPDHGAPIRLIMPGWYGCSCIKWVNEITIVAQDAPPTSQMQEYATRTHQLGSPALAREYKSATIDAAAMPIRVEKWLSKGRIRYRVVGIYWGGTQPVRSLKISFNGGDDWYPVKTLDQKIGDSWALWTYSWAPDRPGKYRIRMKIDDPGVRTQRLDTGYYDRIVDITPN
jgi:DMSO/TMAO reductase YedYZ molybdopterin-dependent catalytic subunit